MEESKAMTTANSRRKPDPMVFIWLFMVEEKDTGKTSCFVMFVWTSAMAEAAVATF
jgi:hypothetical protein